MRFIVRMDTRKEEDVLAHNPVRAAEITAENLNEPGVYAIFNQNDFLCKVRVSREIVWKGRAC